MLVHQDDFDIKFNDCCTEISDCVSVRTMYLEGELSLKLVQTLRLQRCVRALYGYVYLKTLLCSWKGTLLPNSLVRQTVLDGVHRRCGKNMVLYRPRAMFIVLP